MAVLPMKHMHIYALKKDRKQILEILQRRGVVELNDVIQEDSVFHRTDISAAKMQFEKNIEVSKHGLEVLESYVAEQKSMLSVLNGRQELSVKNYEMLGSEQEEILHTAYRLSALDKQVSECNANILKLQALNEALTPWRNLDVSLQFKGTKSTAAFIGSLPGEVTQQEIYIKLAELEPMVEAVNVDLVSSSKDQTCVFVLCARSDAGHIEEALRTMGFARPSSSSKNPPAKQKIELEAAIRQSEQDMEAAKEEIRGYSDKRDALKFIIDYFTMRAEKYEVIGRLVQSRNTFILTGYIPEREIPGVESALNEKFDLFLEFEEPAEDEDIPVLLHNNKFAEPVEGVLRSFSFPGKGEIDPSFIMAIFYYILFGLMLSDAVYGLIMVFACGFCLRKFKNMENGMRKTLRMFFFCGISTTFWGAMFGSWFGDVVKVVSTTFFGRTVTIPPLWFEPITDPMRMLVFSMAVGVIHVFTGLGAKLYQCVRAKQYKDALYDAIFWYMLVGGLIAVLLSTEQFVSIVNLNFILPPIVAKIAGILAAVAAVGIILTAGRESRNWFKRLLKGLYGLYNVTGYLSDILSYSRLLALGLATGVIATVINQMGSMAGGGVVGAILFIVVFLGGHAINIGINLLGAYVHTNRLSFVEFFGKFYGGGGREFAPFAVHTKYYKIKEETSNG